MLKENLNKLAINVKPSNKLLSDIKWEVREIKLNKATYAKKCSS